MTPNKLSPEVKYEGSPGVDTKRVKQKFLQGDVEAVRYQDPNEPKATFYQMTMKGLQVRNGQHAAILDRGRTSFVGQTIPDPTLMSVTAKRFDSLERDR